ncbi:unnamed protein product, partial [Prorocentrum cordatum]
MAEDLAWRPRLRVLCLHGRCQTGETFFQKLERLVAKAEGIAEFVFVDGPVELPLQHGDRVNTRGWFAEESSARGEGVSGTQDGRVRDVLVRAWSEDGPFDGVLGFSEGCLAGLSYCRLAAGAGETAGAGLRFAIFAGAPAAGAAEGAALPIASLHFVSENDTCVPAAESRKFAMAFCGAEVREHCGGHTLPQRADDVRGVCSFLEARRDEVYPPAAAPVLQGGPAEHPDPRLDPEQADELEALEAILAPGEFARVAPAWPVRLAVRLGSSTADHTTPSGVLRFTMPPGYPQAAMCRCELVTDSLALAAHKKDLMAAQLWVEEHQAEIVAVGAGGATAAAAAAEALLEEDDEEGDKANKWWLREEGEVDETLLRDAELRAAELLPSLLGDAAATWARECGAGGFGKPWEFVIGLVGKPSAGKSTFFNAATQPDCPEKEAAMAPHPFTTMSGAARGAYLGRGRGNSFLNDLCEADSLPPRCVLALGQWSLSRPRTSGPPPGQRLGAALSEPAPLRAPHLGRAVWQGGRDLEGLSWGGGWPWTLLWPPPGGWESLPGPLAAWGCRLGRAPAAVPVDAAGTSGLIHVVDASGRSDREGVDQGAGIAKAEEVHPKTGKASGGAFNVLDEVDWVRREIHLWIFCNVRAKWDSVRKKARMATTHVAREALADRLFGLFTGYRASAQLATHVYEAAGFNLAGIAAEVASWGEAQLHLMVACFLRVRFPIVVALNKIDAPTAAAHVAKAQAALGAACVPVSARSEWWLCEQRRKGHLAYTEGAGAESVVLGASAPADVAEQWEKMRGRVLERGASRARGALGGGAEAAARVRLPRGRLRSVR